MAGHSIMQTLLSYKKLSENETNHYLLLKDKTIILYVATLLETNNRIHQTLCLDIVENIVQNKETHAVLLSTFGLYEALETLSIKSKLGDPEFFERTSEILNALKKTAPPAFGTRSRSRRGESHTKKTTALYLLYFEDLNADNRRDIESALLDVRGVISFVVNVPEKRCTLRINAKLSIKTVFKRIFVNCNMRPYLVSRRAGEKDDTLIDLLENLDITCPPEYFPEDDSFVVGQPVIHRFVPKEPKSWFKSISEAWTGAFYW